MYKYTNDYSLKMEQDKFTFLSDSYIEIEGSEKEIAQFINSISKGKIMTELSRKPLPETPVKFTKRNLEKYLK